MTDLQSRLFDIAPYGGAEPTAAETPKPRGEVTLPVEDHVDPWALVRSRTGVYPFFHLENARNDHGAITTVCGLIGTKVTNEGVKQMVRCPSCDLGAQLKA